MHEWKQLIQTIVDTIDVCITERNDEALSLSALAQKLGYSEFYTTRKFKEISGMSLRAYMHKRKLAFALKEVRDSERSLLDIAVDFGFSSHEAFTHSFKGLYGIPPSDYRAHPTPLVLRTKINPFDRYFLGIGEIGMTEQSTNDIQTYFTTIPAHKFLHIKNLESNGYWDFWAKQALIPKQDCETICGLLDSIKGKLDDKGSTQVNSGSGQIMGYINDPNGFTCSWGYPRAECYGVRLPIDYDGDVPEQMLLIDVPEATYIVFEHGPFDYERENRTVEQKIEQAMAQFDYESTDYLLDMTEGRILYFYHDAQRHWKYVRPVYKV